MFTGLIEHIGRVAETAETPAGRRLVLDSCDWAHVPADGASIAVNGCCLTVVAGGSLAFDVIPQTLELTNLGTLQPGDRVNLEAAATMATRFDGHLVQGHVEGTGAVASVIDDDTGRRLRVEVGEAAARLCVAQGSITLQGVSLTVADLGEDWIEVALIPATLEHTTLGQVQVSDRLNVETDMFARHVARLLDKLQG